MIIQEKGKEKVTWRIARWASEEDRKKGIVLSDEEARRLFGMEQFSKFEGNCLLNEGINNLFTIICSSGGVKWDNANARLGVGESATPADPADTGLKGSTKTFKTMDGGYPTYGTAQKGTWKSTYGANDANNAWNEFTVVNAADDSGQNLNRKVSAQGTKVSGQVWELTVEVSLA